LLGWLEEKPDMEAKATLSIHSTDATGAFRKCRGCTGPSCSPTGETHRSRFTVDEAVSSESFGVMQKGRGTKSDTNVLLKSLRMPQVVESLVELSGIEPLTSSLRTKRSPS